MWVNLTDFMHGFLQNTPSSILITQIVLHGGAPGVGLETGRRVFSAAGAAELPSWPLRKAGGPVLPEKTGVAGTPNADAAPALKMGTGAGASGLGVGAACLISHD